MNKKQCLNQSKKEALKCLTGGKAPYLKELLLEDVLVNVGLSLVDPGDNASSFILCPFSFLFFFFGFE